MPTELSRHLPPGTGRKAPTISRVLEGDELVRLSAEGDELALNALEENPFFCRDYLLAARGTIADAAGPKALCIFASGRSDEPEKLIGLLPFESARYRYGVPLDIGLVSQNLFQTSGAPLIDRNHADEAIDGLLAALRTGSGIAQNVLVPNLRHDGPVAQLIRERAADQELEAGFVGRLSRPILRRTDEGSEAYFRRSVAPKRLRELRRAHRRLGELGSVTYRHVTHPGEVRAAAEDFLRIEASGWKGEAGTALLSRLETAAFARTAFAGRCGGAPILSADLLALDGRAIAASLNLQIGRVSFTLKCAYDEAYRRHSAGLVLEYLIVEHLFSARFADELDSCVTEEGHVIGEIWDGTAAIGTLALRPRQRQLLSFGPLGFDLLAAERHRSSLRSQAKQIYRGARMQMSAVAALRPALPAAVSTRPHGSGLAVVIAAVV